MSDDRTYQSTVFDFSPEGLLHLEAQPQTELTFALLREVRALQERVKESDLIFAAAYDREAGLQARIESLEAERDIWRDKARAWSELVPVHGIRTTPGLLDPTPSEIAARVRERKAP